MADPDPAPVSERFHDDLVTFLAERLGVSREAALTTLGDWLFDFERTRDVEAESPRRSRPR